jgi:hypothetical protein
MMTDRPIDDTPPDTFADLPMQPTGSGVADLETAYEQMKLVEDADATLPEDDAEPVAHPS